MSINTQLSIKDASMAQLSQLLCDTSRPQIDNMLLAAVLNGDPAAVEAALSSGANSNLTTVFGFRPLHLAAVCYAERQLAFKPFQQFDRICQLLIEAGADVLARDKGMPKENLYGGEGLTASARAAVKGSAPPSLAKAMGNLAKSGVIDNRTGELDSSGNWHATDAIIDGRRVYQHRRPYRLYGLGNRGRKKAALQAVV